MNYSLLEQHLDGSWWYHGNTFATRAEAEAFSARWIWWDKGRPKTILEHERPLPKKTLSTHDFKTFKEVGGINACQL